jgi:hypothetical protein
MDENPYAAPQTYTPVVGVLSGSREDLRSVAKSQKGILVCILIYIIAVVVRLFLPEDLGLILALGVLVVGIVATVFVSNLPSRFMAQAPGSCWAS